jgi:TonB-linked SusC/RagA family outer membrane protein
MITFMLLLGVTGLSQTIRLTGQVKDITGEPVPFATIIVKATNNTAAADQNGNFSITAPVGSILVISAAGFQPNQVKITDETALSITMTGGNAMDEVVVTALGITRQSKSLGYSTQQIDGAEITKARETNIVNSLAGKLAGVRVTSQSGTLGGSARIIIRGVSSFSGNNNQPLFVIDGFPIDNGNPAVATSTGAAPSGSASVDFGNRASDINPDDIESISVLKGASATALYGSRAKNGAIIITTKRGKKGQMSIAVNSTTRFDKVLKLPEFQNEYAQGLYSVYNRSVLNGWGPKISEVQDQQFTNFLDQQVTLKAYPDNIKNFFETGNTYINSISFDGGDDNSDYRLGYTNTIQDGIIPNQSLLKNSLTLSAGKKFSNKFNTRANLNYTGTISKGRPSQSSNDPNILGNVIYNIPRTLDIQQVKDNYFDSSTGQQRTLTPARNGNNPYWIINNNGYNSNVDRVFGNTIINYKPFSWLNISNNLGLDFYNEFRKGFTRNGTIGALNGNFLEANLFNRIVNNDLIITVNKDINSDLALTALAGGNINDRFFRRSQSYAQELSVDQLYSFSNASSVVTTNFMQQQRIIGLYGEVGLSYKEFLFINITGRNDWSSILPIANRSYFYPSFSSSFIFSHFVKYSWLSYGKLRASFANVGSDDNPYLTRYTYSPQSTAFAQYGYGVNYPFNGALAYSIPITIPSSNLKPQNQASFEVGTEMRFLQNRIKLDFTYYNSVTRDQIVALAVPNSTGYRTIRTNAGTIKNTGVELQLGVIPVKTKNFTWSIDFNFSHNKQIVTELPASISTYTLASGWSSLQIRAEKGKEIGIYGVGWDRDPDGNIIMDPLTGLRTVKSDVRLGNLYPDWMLGINNSFTFQRFNLSFLIDIRQGGSIYSSTVSSARTTGLGIETLANRGRIFIDKGVLPAPDGKFVPNNVPVQSMQDYWILNYNSANTEANIFDASYVKFRELRLSYSLPASILGTGSKIFKGIEVGIEGRNLWIIHDNVPHIDPEVNFFTNSSVGEGVEFNSIPSTRSLGFNVRFKF